MKPIYSLFFLLTFFSHNAFSQDYSKMSANEKAKVIIYGDLYPYSLLLESGTDTLLFYNVLEDRSLKLFFENGKLVQVNTKKTKLNYLYKENKIISCRMEHNKDTTFSAPIYRNDTLVDIINSSKIIDASFDSTLYFKGSDSFSHNFYNYTENTIYDIWTKWTFKKDRIEMKFTAVGNFPHVKNLSSAFFVKNGNVHILTENYSDQKSLQSELAQSDFITEETNEVKIKILKSPKDKPKQEKILELENDID